MDKDAKKMLLIPFIFTLIGVVGLIVILSKIQKQIPKAFSGYDTSIVYHNGKWDTTIVKKQIPSWFR